MNTTLPLMRCCPCFLLRRSVYSYSCAFHPVPVSSSASQPAALMLPRARFLRYSAPYHRHIFLSPYELREWLLFDERHITKSVTCSEIVDKFPPTSNPRILRVGWDSCVSTCRSYWSGQILSLVNPPDALNVRREERKVFYIWQEMPCIICARPRSVSCGLYLLKKPVECVRTPSETVGRNRDTPYLEVQKMPLPNINK